MKKREKIKDFYPQQKRVRFKQNVTLEKIKLVRETGEILKEEPAAHILNLSKYILHILKPQIKE